MCLSSGNRLTALDIEAYSLSRAKENNLIFNQFDCGNDAFNDYLRSTASLEDEQCIGKVWVFATKDRKVAGFVTIAMSYLGKFDHASFQTMSTSQHIPSLLIGEIARDIRHKGKGMGELMLNWVIDEAKKLSSQVGCRLVVVRSIEEKVRRYKELGFIPINDFEEKRNTMFIDLKWYSE